MEARLGKVWLGPAQLGRARLGQAGIAALEFGLVAPIIVVLALGGIGIGQGLQAKNKVMSAARASAAYAIKNISAPMTAVQTAGLSATSLDASQGLSITATHTPSACISATGVVTAVGSGPCPNGSNPGTYVEVSATMPYTFVTPMGYVGLGTGGTLTAKQTVRLQ